MITNAELNTSVERHYVMVREEELTSLKLFHWCVRLL